MNLSQRARAVDDPIDLDVEGWGAENGQQLGIDQPAFADQPAKARPPDRQLAA